MCTLFPMKLPVLASSLLQQNHASWVIRNNSDEAEHKQRDFEAADVMMTSNGHNFRQSSSSGQPIRQKFAPVRAQRFPVSQDRVDDGETNPTANGGDK